MRSSLQAHAGGSADIFRLPRRGHASQAVQSPAIIPPPMPKARATGGSLNIDGIIVVLVALAMILVCTVSSALLSHWKVHYVTSGGAFYEKLHPATYLVFIAFFLTLMRRTDPIGEIGRVLLSSSMVMAFLFCWTLLLLHTVLALDKPFTGIIDTFILPFLLVLVIWSLPPQKRWPLVLVLHALMLINIALGYYEFLSGHRLIPLVVGNTVIHNEWRATALLGHPLKAAGFVGAYVLALVLRPNLIPSLPVRLGMILFGLGSLMAFGGRTSLVLVLAVLACFAAYQGWRLMRGVRIPLSTVIILSCMVCALIGMVLLLLDQGFFDRMVTRFSSDKGSASTRLASLQLLSYFDWRELILGPDPVRANALQAQLGLAYGIESFWISCIVQYGIVHTVLLTIGLVCLFTEVVRRAHPSALVVVLFVTVIASSSVSFSSKNAHLAEYMMVLVLLFMPEKAPRPPLAAPGRLRVASPHH